MSQRGQVTVEAVLIIVVMMALFTLVQRSLFKDKEYLSNFIEQPWLVVSGLIENGAPGDPEKGRIKHPGHFSRHIAMFGENP